MDGGGDGGVGGDGRRGRGWNITDFEEVGVPGGVEVEVGVGGIFGLGCVVSGWMDGCLIEGGREGREGRGRMEDGRYHCEVRCDMVGLM